MSARRNMPETFREFFNRRYRELKRSSEWGEISRMNVDDFAEMMQNEYYDCANDLIPPITEPDDKADSMLH